jgi:hypothetical protein
VNALDGTLTPLDDDRAAIFSEGERSSLHRLRERFAQVVPLGAG